MTRKMSSADSIGMSSTSRTTITFVVFFACVTGAAAGGAASSLMQSGAFFGAFWMGVVIVSGWSSLVPCNWFSGFRGGKFNLPIFCTVAVATSRSSTDALSLLLGGEFGLATGPFCGECLSNRFVVLPLEAVGIAAPVLPDLVVFAMSAM